MIDRCTINRPAAAAAAATAPSTYSERSTAIANSNYAASAVTDAADNASSADDDENDDVDSDQLSWGAPVPVDNASVYTDDGISSTGDPEPPNDAATSGAIDEINGTAATTGG